MSDLATDYIVLWASQTGNAEWIAKNIHTEAGKKGYTGQCFVMNDFALVKSLYSIRSKQTNSYGLHYRHHWKKLVLLLWSHRIQVTVMHLITHSSFGASCVATRTRPTFRIRVSQSWA